MAKELRHPYVPRVDLVSDMKYWKEVMWNCWHLEKDLYYLLHGLRSGGAELVRTQGSYRLMPGEWSETEWEDIKQNQLSPFRKRLIEIFKLTGFGQVSNEELSEGVFAHEHGGAI
ncbi:MAG: hypothetical protein ACYDEJ_03325 [Desulfitobacteriaceae bacterium]